MIPRKNDGGLAPVHTRIIPGVVLVYTESEFVRRFVLPANRLFDAILTVTGLGRVFGAALICWGTKKASAD